MLSRSTLGVPKVLTRGRREGLKQAGSRVLISRQSLSGQGAPGQFAFLSTEVVIPELHAEIAYWCRLPHSGISPHAGVWLKL